MDRMLTYITEQEARRGGPVDDDLWVTYDSGLDSIDEFFRSLISATEGLPFGSIPEYVNWFRNRFGKLPVGLEIAGQGKTFSDLVIDGVATCLAFPEYLVDRGGQPDLTKRVNSPSRVFFVTGDISEHDTWKKIGQCFKNNDLERPSLILYVPAGGIGYIPMDFKFYRNFIGYLTRCADQRSFLFVGEYPSVIEKDLSAYLRSPNIVNRFSTNISSNADGGKFVISKV